MAKVLTNHPDYLFLDLFFASVNRITPDLLEPHGRRWRLGGGEAGGGRFGVGAAFSGGGALRGSSSSRATCGGSGPGAVLEFLSLPPDPCWRQIWWLERRLGRLWWIRSASPTKTAAARWSSWRGRALAVLVHRLKFRRCAVDGSCGGLQQRRCPRGVVRRWTAAFAVDAAGNAAVCSPVSPTYGVLYFVFVLCTVYLVQC